MTTVTFTGGALFCLLTYSVALLTGWVEPVDLNVSTTVWSSFFVYSIAAMGISQALWLAAVKHLGIGLAGYHLNATPFYVMIILVLLGQSWDANQLAGAIILLIGVVVAQLDDRRMNQIFAD